MAGFKLLCADRERAAQEKTNTIKDFLFMV
jgi:hypothetical protein